MPIYLTTMPDICKGVSNEANIKVPSEFSHSMKVLPLSTIDHVEIWTTQVEEMAKSCGCYRELSTRFGVFPKPGSVEAFVCQTRYQACWRILHETISGPVWAYMRALGYAEEEFWSSFIKLTAIVTFIIIGEIGRASCRERV